MEVEGEIKRGAFGLVERVRLDDGTRAARKTFDPTAPELRTDRVRQRFCREARLQSALGSRGPHVIPVLQYHLEGAAPWYLMPLAACTLDDWIKSHVLTDASWHEVLVGVLDSLEAIHDLEYFHRDLKPSNVLLHESRWKISDFGIALPSMSDMTQFSAANSVWGTTIYMPPEQAQDFHNVDARADIYAFGCILHDIFGSGNRVPHHEQTARGPMGDVIAKCTKVRREERYANIAEVRADVIRALREVRPPDDVEIASADWLERVRSDEWTQDQVTAFVEFLRGEPHDEDALLDELRPAAIRSIFGTDEEAWILISRRYCKHAHGTFPFAFCDVVVQGLATIYKLGGVGIRSLAVHATAELGASHNRWHVMRRLRPMAGHAIDEALAKRIIVDAEISEDAGRRKRTLVICAEHIGMTTEAMYHPLISSWLSGDED